MASLDQAIQQMLADGMPPFPDGAPRLDTNRVIRYGPKNTAWYRLFDFPARNGKRYISGAYGIWGRLDATKIRSDYSDMHDDERERVVRSIAELERAEQVKRLQKARFAFNHARQQWNAARAQLPDGVQCAYLVRKGVLPEKGLRYLADGSLLVPMIRYDIDEATEADPAYEGLRRLVGVQTILLDGTKRFNKGMAKQGAACRFGKAKDGQLIIVAEGLATALTIREATDRKIAVFVAFDAYNLEPAAAILRALYPASPMLFAADDDFKTDGNPGRTRAERAASAVGNAQVVWPVFAAERGDKDTDFNDLMVGEGSAQVAAQLAGAIGALTAPAAAPGGENAALAGAAPEKAAAKKKDDDLPDWAMFWKLIDRFTLLYPSDTAYDHELHDIVAISHMNHKFGKRYVAMWLANEKRRDVNMCNVVFEPGAPVRPDYLNLFHGFAIEPSDGECRWLLELLHYLCGENIEDAETPVTSWVLKWLAYPLQHPGAKMQTTLVMSGKEGTGKNLFFGCVRAIYGEHGGIITQRQLESQFNSWMSAKLFLIANEVITRAEMRHNAGLLKTLITEPEVWINRKQKDERFEANHCNMVFFSNEAQPVQIGVDDRRFLVIKTPPPRAPEYYAEARQHAQAANVAALYRYLLDLDLGDFNEHSKPIVTAAKDDLIEIGMASPQLLWKDLHDGEIGLPYIPARVEDVYRVYQVWSRRNGVKMPAQINRFSPDFMSMNGIRRKKLRVPDIDFGPDGVTTGASVQRKVFLMGDPPAGVDASEWVTESVIKFAQAAQKYWDGGKE